MCWWSYEWPQHITWQPFFYKRRFSQRRRRFSQRRYLWLSYIYIRQPQFMIFDCHFCHDTWILKVEGSLSSWVWVAGLNTGRFFVVLNYFVSDAVSCWTVLSTVHDLNRNFFLCEVDGMNGVDIVHTMIHTVYIRAMMALKQDVVQLLYLRHLQMCWQV